MDGWALAASCTPQELADLLRDAVTTRGLRVIKDYTKASVVAQVFRHDEGAHVIVHGVPNIAVARAITDALGADTSYLELRLEDTAVSATLTELPGGATEDLDEDAYEILTDWNDGEDRKFYSESYDDLVRALLDLDGCARKATAKLCFESTTSGRVANLVRQIQNGGRWERTTIGGQSAIRVSGPSGTQISVLTPAEEAELLAAIGG